MVQRFDPARRALLHRTKVIQRLARIHDPRWVAVATVVIQLILVSLTFPLAELLTQTPLIQNDNAYHLYQMKLGRELADDGVLVGYDPTFGGGYPGGLPYNWSGKAPWLLAVIFRGTIPDVVLYKAYVFLCAVLGPACVPLALRWLGRGAPEAAIAGLLALLLWWVSWFRWLFTEGLVSFVTMAYISVPYLAAVYQFLIGQRGIASVCTLAIGAGALFFFNPHFPLAISLGTLLLLVMGLDRVQLRRWVLALLVVPAVSVAINTPWLVLMQRYTDRQSLLTYVAGFHIAGLHLVFAEFIGRYTYGAYGSKLYAPILLSTLVVFLSSRQKAERRLMAVFTGLGLTLIAYAGFAGALPILRDTQPNRFAPVGYLFLVVPASVGIMVMLGVGRSDQGKTRTLVARLTLIALAIPVGYAIYELSQEVSRRGVGHYGHPPPQVRPLPIAARCIMEWLRHETTRDGRVLFEVFPARGHASDVAYYAFALDRQFIGGPMPRLFFASFANAKLFGRPIASISPQDFQTYMNAYNIGWIVAYHPDTKMALHRFEHIVKERECDDVDLFRVDQPLSYFLEGHGIISQVEPNNIQLRDLDSHTIVLKYHYVDGLRSVPPAAILPAATVPGLPPFIRIVAPAARLQLFLGHPPPLSGTR